MSKNKLTILIGAGAVIDASSELGEKITTEKITTDTLNNEYKYNDKTVLKLLNDINNHLLKHTNARYNYTPNFEDLFHSLEILKSLLLDEDVAPEFKPFAKIFTNLNETYKNLQNNKGRILVSKSISHIINIIQKNIETYSNKEPVDWYKSFFKNLSKQYNLNIFTLNYDTWFDIIYPIHNDGFTNINDSSDYLYFNPKKLLKSKNNVTINYLHGQLNLAFLPVNEAKKEFGITDFTTICKIKDPIKTKRQLVYNGGTRLTTTQSGETYTFSTIITGKMKTEKVSIQPFDIYRTNLSNSLVNNPNLLIIGYGFEDLYINNILSQFHKLHGTNKKVIIIDYANKDNWNNSNDYYRYNVTINKFHTIWQLLGDNKLENVIRSQYKDFYTLDNGRGKWYLKGFKNTAMDNVNDIINFYN